MLSVSVQKTLFITFNQIQTKMLEHIACNLPSLVVVCYIQLQSSHSMHTIAHGLFLFISNVIETEWVSIWRVLILPYCIS